MPIEKLLTSISKPAFMRPCVSLSNHRIVYPPSGPHDHGSDEHRDVAADDDAHGGNGPDYPAAFAGDVAPGRIGDQQRQQVGQHRVDQACHLGVGPPSRGDEERRDESPRDERADVGHDHAAQGPAEFLYLLSHSFSSCI